MRVVFLFLFCISISSEPVNPWLFRITARQINRKDISHLVLEKKEGHFRVTLLASERRPYSYKSGNFPFFIRVSQADEALELSQKISQFLESGENLVVSLNGSEIVEIHWGEIATAQLKTK